MVSQHGRAINIASSFWVKIWELGLPQKYCARYKLFFKNFFSVKRKEYANRNQLPSVEKQINGHGVTNGHADHHDQQMKEDTSVIEHE